VAVGEVDQKYYVYSTRMLYCGSYQRCLGACWRSKWNWN